MVSATDRPSIDPELMIRMLIIGYVRRQMRTAHRDIVAFDGHRPYAGSVGRRFAFKSML